jgi:thiol:disulfide interchange protein DsbA
MYKALFAGAFSLMIALAGLMFSPTAPAQGTPSEGIDYLALKHPQTVEASGKIEVIEFFWYGCPHCYNLEPVIQPWIKSLPADTQFRRVPAVFNEGWAVAARLYYTFESLGLTERLHKPFFDAIHRERLNIVAVKDKTPVLNEPAVADWLKKQGVDTDKFMSVYRSFGVESSVRRAAQMTQSYGIDGVPTMGVQGLYIVSATMSGERDTMLAVTDYLINETRKKPAGGAGRN